MNATVVVECRNAGSEPELTPKQMLAGSAIYFAIGLLTATVCACIIKLSYSKRNRLWYSERIEGSDFFGPALCIFAWPLIWLVFIPYYIWRAVLAFVKSTRMWSRIPEWEDVHPFDWLFGWPANLMAIWSRRKTERAKTKEDGSDRS